MIPYLNNILLLQSKIHAKCQKTAFNLTSILIDYLDFKNQI